jgi:ABC transporter substrate binding protein (PQQ-dependent alcohol dehydrogenase system)
MISAFARVAGLLAGLAIGITASAPGFAQAEPAPAAVTKSVTIGYVELASDPRYDNAGAFAGIQFYTLARPFTGAEVAIDEAQDVGRLLKMEFRLEKSAGADVATLTQTIKGWVANGTHFVVADLPADALVQLADAVKDQPVLLVNVSAPDDALRAAQCRVNVLHTFPSNAMLADALGQYLAVRNWKRILVLEGPSPEDTAMVDAFRRTAQKFGLTIAEERKAVLSNDPNQREQSNVALMTQGVDYDVVYVADSGFEIGRYVPYQTSLPRPVVGSAGLAAEAWSWSWDQDAGAQLQHRYEAKALPYRMNSGGWAAWEAVKAITSAVVRTKEGDFTKMTDYLLGDRLNLDTVKGSPGNFRTWDHQLRQPLLLATPDAVIARAPFPEFLHETNDLDTLGIDAAETECRF